ncbi:MAG TPA: hypothetical protein VHX42_05295 [Candidatus Babeliales bacterium]|jgi:hypothetical protein|nr:hypothetical protein [Candidatus Babeliales bacterium]
MQSKFLVHLFIFSVIQTSTMQSTVAMENHSQSYQWAVVGAGVAGITALAVLLDCGVEPSAIAWIDPEFNIGRIGKYYRDVPGNVQTSRLILYVQGCPYFKDIISPSLDALYTYNSDEYQPLHVIADPLGDFTAYLRNQVDSMQDSISSLDYNDDHWVLQGTHHIINAEKVILAIGAYPKSLNFDVPEIPLDEALNKNTLATLVSPDDSIAVFGGMHSAILILKFLSDLSVKKIVNFYLDPYFYGAPGLEGATAAWAQNVLEQNPPSNLSRVLSTPENRKAILPQCTKAIYAIGYQMNPIIVNGSSNLLFDENSGIIATNLYGIGMAFPPTGIINGQKIARNGLMTYLTYAKRLVPQWVNNERFKEPISSHRIDTDPELPWI